MTCVTCLADHLTSTVSKVSSNQTIMAAHEFTDHANNSHFHDPNTFFDHFKCTNGHTWTVESVRPCWCKWIPESALKSSLERISKLPTPQDNP